MKKPILFLKCSGNFYGCKDGACISIEKHCDEVADCADFSDEMNCEMIKIDQSRYRKVQLD